MADGMMEKRKERWVKFLDMSKPSPNLFKIHYGNTGGPVLNANDDKKTVDERIENWWVGYNTQMEIAEWLADDSIPALNGSGCFTGTEIFAEAFGCKVHRAPGQMPWALPMVFNIHDAAKLKVPKLCDSSLYIFMEAAEKLREKAGGQGILKLPDMQSPMDTLSLIWDKNDLFVSVVDEPEAVKEAAHKVFELFTAFLDEWFSRFGKEFIAHYPDYYMPGGITLSNCEIGTYNPDMFNEFFKPEMAELSGRYGGLGIHTCAYARQHWESIKSLPGLKLLNLCPGEKDILDAYAFFADTCAQWNAWYGERPLWQSTDRIPEKARYLIEVFAGTKEEALRFSEKLTEICKK
jgi:hypothetical protein